MQECRIAFLVTSQPWTTFQDLQGISVSKPHFFSSKKGIKIMIRLCLKCKASVLNNLKLVHHRSFFPTVIWGRNACYPFRIKREWKITWNGFHFKFWHKASKFGVGCKSVTSSPATRMVIILLIPKWWKAKPTSVEFELRSQRGKMLLALCWVY